MMNILYLCNDPGIPVLGNKGASVHVREMVAAFGQAGHNVVLAAPTLNKSPWEKPAPCQAYLSHIPVDPAVKLTGNAIKAYAAHLNASPTLTGEVRRVMHNQEVFNRLLQQFDDHKPDLIYERYALFSTAGVQLAQALGCPLVLEVNAPLALEQRQYRGACLTELAQQAERWVFANADLTLTVSSPLRDYVIDSGAAAERVHVLPNAVNTAHFHPAARNAAVRKRWGIGPGPVLGFVGGMRPWHDMTILPRLLAQLTQHYHYPELQLVVVGDGPVKKSLTQALEQHGLRQRVIFTDWMPHEEVPALIREFDIALAPYAPTEHLFYFSPLKLFEYMACGVAVVAADIGQISDVIRDDENGLLYPPGDVGEMAAACHRLLSSPTLQTNLGARAAELIRAEFTWGHNARRVTEWLQTIPTTALITQP